MKGFIKHIIPAAALFCGVGLTSCTKDLDVTPIDPNLKPVNVPALLNKCYANMALQGNSGPNGDCDIDGLDGGTSGFVRQLFNTEELPTDEAICAWGDDGISNFNFNSVDATHPMTTGFYYRLYFGVTMCNQFLQVCPENETSMRAQARYLRALYYYYLMNAFGNISVKFEVSATAGEQWSRAKMAEFLEKELLEIEGDLDEAKPEKMGEPGYGKIDKAADWMLLSRLYLNWEVYTGTSRWEDAAKYSKMIMDSPFKLFTKGMNNWSAYQMLFMGDNSKNGASVEAILPIIQNGQRTASWATTQFLMASTFDPTMHANVNDQHLKAVENPETHKIEDLRAINGTQHWAGNRARPDLVAKFFPKGNAPAIESFALTKQAGDDRALFWGEGRTLNIEKATTFLNGFSVTKYNNFYATTKDGKGASDAGFPDTHFFLMRSAEAYLTYAEATARLNGGTTTSEGTEAINALRNRANNKALKAAYSLTDILDEWSREFYFEGRRRTDLVRFNKFGGNTNYTWQWKGGSMTGRTFPSYMNVYPLPASDLNVNKNLQQNPGYAQ